MHGKAALGAVLTLTAATLTSAVVAASPTVGATVPVPTKCVLNEKTFPVALAAQSSPTKPGWVASDGFASVKVNANQSLWFLGDTLYGTRVGEKFTGGTFKRNTVLVYNRTNANCFTSLAGADDRGVFTVPGDAHQAWIWPGNPTTNGQNIVATPMAVMGATTANGSSGGFNFTHKTTELRTYLWDGATLLPRSTRTMKLAAVNPPASQATPIAWTSNVVDGTWVYLFGSSRRNQTFGFDIYMARVPAAEWFAATSTPLDSKVQYLTAQGWQGATARYATLRRIANAEADAAVSVLRTPTGLHVVTKANSMLGTRILDFYAPADPAGVWKRADLGPAPARAGAWSYSLYLHPELERTGKTVYATLDFNSADQTKSPFEGVSRYRPVMFKIALP